jgi:molybdenum cofactor guanylyltransferase
MSAIKGLVLAGGHSRRMGSDKAFIHYHGQPQYKHTAALLEQFCDTVAISCRKEQQHLFTGYETMVDDENLGQIGPINGVITAMRETNNALFVLGVDYPNITVSTISTLIANRNPEQMATAFFQPETSLPEPLICLYEGTAVKKLEVFIAQGKQSLRDFLLEVGFNGIRAPFPQEILSIDFPIT